MRVIDTNDAFCNMVGRSRAEVIGSLLPEILADEFRQHIVDNRDQLLTDDYRKEGLHDGQVIAIGTDGVWGNL